jgi:hypothetical protein
MFVGFEGEQTAKLAINKGRAPFVSIAFALKPKPYSDPNRDIARWASSEIEFTQPADNPIEHICNNCGL